MFWHTATPPHVGDYPIRTAAHRMLRYWNGKRWSAPWYADDPDTVANTARRARADTQGVPVEWTDPQIYAVLVQEGLAGLTRHAQAEKQLRIVAEDARTHAATERTDAEALRASVTAQTERTESLARRLLGATDGCAATQAEIGAILAQARADRSRSLVALVQVTLSAD